MKLLTIAGLTQLLVAVCCCLGSVVVVLASEENSATVGLHHYRPSPKLTGPAKFSHSPDDEILNELDHSLTKISTVYMQALFSGTHTPELDARMRSLEIVLFDLLDSLYKQNRMADYMKYEAEVTRQMILYNMLKKLFGYAVEENERIK